MLLLNKARSKLMQCAMVKDHNRDYDLRQMVAHANLLDTLLRAEDRFEAIDAVHEGVAVPPPPQVIGKNGEIISPQRGHGDAFDMDDKEYHNLTDCSEMVDRCRQYGSSLQDTGEKPYYMPSGLEPAEEDELVCEEERAEEEQETLMEQGELPEDMDGYHSSTGSSPTSSKTGSPARAALPGRQLSPAEQAADQALRDMHYANAISAAYNHINPAQEAGKGHHYIDA